MTAPSHAASGGRPGFTLVELLVAITISGIIGLAVLGMISGQLRLSGTQDALRGTRMISRAAANILTSEMRMVETAAGVTAASSTSLTVNVPYAFGLICDVDGDDVAVTLAPLDDATFFGAALSGVAWRKNASFGAEEGEYEYVADAEIDVGAGGAADACADAGIATLEGGMTVMLDEVGGTTPPVAAPIFLYQQITYSFVDIGGDNVTLRRAVAGGTTEDLVSPFVASGTEFRYYVEGQTAAQDAPVADLGILRGVQIVLDPATDATIAGDADPLDPEPTITAVFFRNRL